MKLATERFQVQAQQWPRVGQHILAHYDDSSIVVYQAYRPSIGRFAIDHQRLGGPDFTFSRMSWIKPNFLWMMYRSGWGTKEGQEITLGLRIRRTFFDSILEQAVPSGYDPDLFADRGAWEASVEESNVRLQWDPDHSPSGAKLERRAIQLGLRGSVLEAFAKTELVEVIDLTQFVASQRANVEHVSVLQTPVERVYVPRSVRARERVGLYDARDG